MTSKNRWSLAAGLTLIVVVLAWFGYSQLDNTFPAQLTIEPSVFDFGTVSDKTEATFIMSNEGGSLLEILGVSTSCGCTTAWFDQDVLMPGTTGVLHVSFDPSVHEGIEGEVIRQIYVRSNDPEQPELTIELRATVVANQESP